MTNSMSVGSLREAVQTWIDFHTPGARPATVRYHRELQKIILDQWPGDPDAPLATLVATTVAEFALRIAHYSAPRFNALVSIVRAVAGDSARQLRRRPVTPKHVTLPGQAEFAELLRELDRCKHGNAGLVVRFLALTGLRIGEARRLTWAAVTERGLLVPGTATKNGRARLIPFIGELASVLERLRSVTKGEHMLPQANCRRALKEAAKRAGVSRLSHHDLRRIFATRAIQCGVDLPTAAKWMGHLDGGALLGRTYFHLLDEHSAAMAGRVKIAA
jgi:integrase